MDRRDHFTVYAKDFEYEAGEWKRPTYDGEPAQLTFGDSIETTATVDAFDLGDTGTAYIVFTFVKPKWERCFGWHDSELEFTAVLGSKYTTSYGMGKRYHDLPVGYQSTCVLQIDLSGNKDPIHHKLQLIITDKVTTTKAGLHFYSARVFKK